MIEKSLGAGCTSYAVLGRSEVVHGIADQADDLGPGFALYDFFVQQEDHQSFLILPVDMPLLPVSYLRYLMQQSSSACFEGERFPFYLKLDKNLLKRENALRHFFAPFRANELSVPVDLYKDHAFLNANSPDDYRRLSALYTAHQD